MSIIRFDSMEDLVEKANNTIYGLAAAVVTKDLDKALHVANNIRAGSVWQVFIVIICFYLLISDYAVFRVNCYDVFDAAAPFGGYKQSGKYSKIYFLFHQLGYF